MSEKVTLFNLEALEKVRFIPSYLFLKYPASLRDRAAFPEVELHLT
ncbi:hypothetical protein H6F96_28420 [Microcoleus sp. FACHB-53]|nr:hypothetical protein [Microcoleus sp. FACHB-53]